MFIGYPKSGHSIIGSLIDAHRNAIIAHEYNVIGKIQTFKNRNDLFKQLYRQSATYAKKSKGGHFYAIDSQWNGNIPTGHDIQIIGDKRGGTTSELLTNHQIIDVRMKAIMKLTGVPIKLIHVIRNPFDVIASIERDLASRRSSAGNFFFNNCKNNIEIKNYVDQNNSDIELLEFRHENFVINPEKYMQEICNYLNLPVYDGYIQDCCSIINRIPSKSRYQRKWTEKEVKTVHAKIKNYSFLAGYEYTERENDE